VAIVGHPIRVGIAILPSPEFCVLPETAFAKALIDPPRPAAKLTAAKRRHAALIR